MEDLIRRLDAQAAAIRDLQARLAVLEATVGSRSGGDTRIPLTDAARKRLARGATKGAGTNVCATCGKEKEPRRLNSNRCKECDAR